MFFMSVLFIISVSCQAGEYLNQEGVCELCAPGTHQLLSEQTSCPPCPIGSYSEEGWEYCLSMYAYAHLF